MTDFEEAKYHYCAKTSLNEFFHREIGFRDLYKANVCRGIGYLAKPYVVFKIILTSRFRLSEKKTHDPSSILDSRASLPDLEFLQRKRLSVRRQGSSVHGLGIKLE